MIRGEKGGDFSGGFAGTIIEDTWTITRWELETGGMWGKENLGVLLVGMQMGAATVENSTEFPQKLKMDLPFDPVISLLGLYLKNPETPIQKNVCTQMFIAAQFTIAKCWKQPKCPSVNEWIKKLWYIYTMECYTTERK